MPTSGNLFEWWPLLFYCLSIALAIYSTLFTFLPLAMLANVQKRTFIEHKLVNIFLPSVNMCFECSLT